MNILSPLSKTNNIELLKTIPTSFLIDNYKRAYNIQIGSIMEEVKEISLFECKDTGYKFFHPFNITGDGDFYEQLQNFEWYYMPWKWEHQLASSIIQSGMKVLEIGCANGDFISKIQLELGAHCTGLELNKNAAEVCVKRGLSVYIQTIQEFAKDNVEVFDIVCSFQVLEHVSDVHSFLEAMVVTLKKGAKLIIGVPNNDSFLGMSDNLLNMPPHHMGLWNEKALNALTKIFPLKLVKHHFEPLQDYHKDYYNKVINDDLMNILYKNVEKFGFLGRIKNQFIKKTHSKKLSLVFPHFASFTVVAEFTKI